MKKLCYAFCVSLPIFSTWATTYDVDLSKVYPKCNNYLITESSTRQDVIQNCNIVDKHSARVRLLRGTQKLDILTSNVGLISCKFKMSAVNQDGTLKGCYSQTPIAMESSVASK